MAICGITNDETVIPDFSLEIAIAHIDNLKYTNYTAPENGPGAPTNIDSVRETLRARCGDYSAGASTPGSGRASIAAAKRGCFCPFTR